MGNPKAFLTIHRKEAGYRPVHDRIHDFGEVEQTLNSNDRRTQASRCMDCGVPFCHWACPLGNKPPEWNDALYKGDWELAYRLLSSTNDFPEFTGRICPALCEKACVLNLMEHEPTTNREDEAAITEHAFEENYVRVRHPERNGKTVAVVGCGPAGLVAATRIKKKGYDIYDPTDDFYNDICSSYSINGIDVPLKDRRNEFYQNVSFCESGCIYQGINYTSNNVICNCTVKTEISTDETEDETSTKSFTNSIFSVNIIVMKCFKLTLHWDSLKNNCGFWFTMACFILVTSLIIYVIAYEYKSIHTHQL